MLKSWRFLLVTMNDTSTIAPFANDLRQEIEDEGSSGESATNDVLFRVGDRIRGRYGNDAQFVATIGEFLEQHGEVRVRCEGRCSDMFLKVQQGDILDGKDEPCTSLA